MTTNSRKNRLSWSAGLMLCCGAILLVLPWLSTRRNWDKNWDKPEVAPLWKAKNFSAARNNTAFPEGEKWFLNVAGNSVHRWATSTGKRTTFILPPSASWQNKISADGKIVAMPRKKNSLRFFVRSELIHPWITTGRSSQQSTQKLSRSLTFGVWQNCGFDIYNVATKKKRLFLAASPAGTRTTVTNGKTAIEGQDDIFLSGDSRRAAIFSTLFDPRGNAGYGQVTHHFRLYDCLTGRLILSRTVARDRDADFTIADFTGADIWVFSEDGQHFYEASTQRENQSDPWDTVKLYDWVSNKTALLKVGKHISWNFWHSPTLSHDGRTFAVVSKTTGNSYSNDGEDGTIYIWNLNSRRLVYKFRQENFDPRVIAFSPDQKYLAVGGSDYSVSGAFATKGKLLILSAQNGQVVSNLSEESPRDRFQQSKMQKEQQLALRLGTYKSPRTAIYLPGDSGPVESLAFSPDSTKLAAGYGNGEIKMWRAPK